MPLQRNGMLLKTLTVHNSQEDVGAKHTKYAFFLSYEARKSSTKLESKNQSYLKRPSLLSFVLV